eukprot:10896628-Lingulodinium_polyedra.AAC.1
MRVPRVSHAIFAQAQRACRAARRGVYSGDKRGANCQCPGQNWCSLFIPGATCFVARSRVCPLFTRASAYS